MSVTAIPNSGIMFDDRLDNLRGAAIMAAHDTPIPLAIAAYIQALERDYLRRLHERHLQSIQEIGFNTEAQHD